MTENTWSIYTLPVDEPGQEPLKVIMAKDGSAFVVGEDRELVLLIAALNTYYLTGETAGELPKHDCRLGWKWLSVTEAVTLSAELGTPADGRTIRWAAAHGWIREAKRDKRGWTFPQVTFLHWLRNRPKPGRK